MRSFVETIDEMDNPFQESSEDLLQMNTWGFANEGVVETVRKNIMVGQEQYTTFVKERLIKKNDIFVKPKLNHHSSVVISPKQRHLDL